MELRKAQLPISQLWQRAVGHGCLSDGAHRERAPADASRYLVARGTKVRAADTAQPPSGIIT